MNLKEFTLQAIKSAARHGGVTTKDVMSRSRKEPIARARQIAMWASYHHRPEPCIQKAKAFGKDHGTMIHAKNAIDGFRTYDKVIRDQSTKVLYDLDLL
jgi:chromosomal replication initiation ATPase DnaA